MTRISILVADDDPAMRAWLRGVLGQGGVELREAASGVEVLTALAEDPTVDLVVSDVRMPSPSGLQVLAIARTAGVEAPFLLITAFGDDELCRSERRMGAEVLDKPFTSRALRESVAALLPGTRPHG